MRKIVSISKMWFDPRREIENFSAPAYYPGSGLTAQPLALDDYVGKYVVLLFLPMDETKEVSLTEVEAFSRVQSKASHDDYVILGIVPRSVDEVGTLMKTGMGQGGFRGANFPILCDESRRISLAFHLDNRGGISRGLCVIGRHRYMRYKTVYHRHVGRNAEEALRVLDQLRQSDEVRRRHSIVIEGAKKPMPKPFHHRPEPQEDEEEDVDTVASFEEVTGYDEPRQSKPLTTTLIAASKDDPRLRSNKASRPRTSRNKEGKEKTGGHPPEVGDKTKSDKGLEELQNELNSARKEVVPSNKTRKEESPSQLKGRDDGTGRRTKSAQSKPS